MPSNFATKQETPISNTGIVSCLAYFVGISNLPICLEEIVPLRRKRKGIQRTFNQRQTCKWCVSWDAVCGLPCNTKLQIAEFARHKKKKKLTGMYFSKLHCTGKSEHKLH